MACDRAGEGQGRGVRVGGSKDSVPVEYELAEVHVPAAGREVGVGEPARRGMSVGVEGGSRVVGVARPPADAISCESMALRIRKSWDGGSAGSPEIDR
jgi:hypothetical protein